MDLESGSQRGHAMPTMGQVIDMDDTHADSPLLRNLRSAPHMAGSPKLQRSPRLPDGARDLPFAGSEKQGLRSRLAAVGAAALCNRRLRHWLIALVFVLVVFFAAMHWEAAAPSLEYAKERLKDGRWMLQRFQWQSLLNHEREKEARPRPLQVSQEEFAIRASLSPYRLPGQLMLFEEEDEFPDGQFNVTEKREHVVASRWVPFEDDEARDPSRDYVAGLMKLYDLVYDTNRSEAVRQFTKIRRWDVPQLKLLQDKVVLHIGDSVERSVVNTLAHLVGHDEFSTLHDLYKTGTFDVVDTDMATSEELARQPFVVNLPFINMTIISAMTQGFLATEDTFRHRENLEPREIHAKIRKLADALAASHIRPDVIMVHSGLWDLATLNLERVKRNRPASKTLTSKEIRSFMQEARLFIRWIQTVFPDALFFGRTALYTTETEGTWFMDGLPGDYEHIPRKPFADAKVNSINQALRMVYEELSIPYVDWNELAIGFRDHMDDAIHPDLYLNYVYDNAWLDLVANANL